MHGIGLLNVWLADRKYMGELGLKTNSQGFSEIVFAGKEINMSINHVNTSNIAGYSYAYKSNSRTAQGASSFMGGVQRETQKLAAGQGTAEKTKSSVWAGDMVISQPPNYSGLTYDAALTQKSKAEMTMDEYKSWFMNEMSKMPVSAWYRSTCVGGTLTITEEAFERMKNDPEWENTVMNMVRKMYSANGMVGSKMIGNQVIGASPEQCYGEGIPVGTNSFLEEEDDDGFWTLRMERHKKYLELQQEAAVRRQKMMRMGIESGSVSIAELLMCL